MYLLDILHLTTIQSALEEQAIRDWGENFLQQDRFWESDLQETMQWVEDSLHLLGYIPIGGLLLVMGVQSPEKYRVAGS